MKPSQLAQLLIGIILGLMIVGGAIGGAGYFYLNRFSQIPVRPKFVNDDKAEKTPAKPQPYKAVVIYGEGLFLRKERSTDSEVLKVLEYEEPVMVMEVSPDQKWQKIKTDTEVEAEQVEGWVSAGNTERIAEQESSDPEPLPEESEPIPEEAF